MIYVVKESLIHNTIEMDTYVSGIEAETFEEAKSKLISILSKIKDVEIYLDMSNSFAYYITGYYKTSGVLEYNPLKMIG